MLTGILAPYYYVVHLESVEVNGTTATVPTGTYTSSVLDTGTSMFIIQATAFDTMATTIEADPAFQAVMAIGDGGTADAGGGGTFFSRQDCMSMTSSSSRRAWRRLPRSRRPTSTRTFRPSP